MTIKLEQEERPEFYHIGMSFGKGNAPDKNAIGKDLTCINSHSVSMDVNLIAGDSYWLLPQTFQPELLGKFTLSVYVHDPETNVSIAPM